MSTSTKRSSVVSAKLRFDILRRDNFTCQYCGQTAPQVVLHIDHVFPVAFGGKASRWNLVAACADCNLGKQVEIISSRSRVGRLVMARHLIWLIKDPDGWEIGESAVGDVVAALKVGGNYSALESLAKYSSCVGEFICLMNCHMDGRMTSADLDALIAPHDIEAAVAVVQ